MDKAIFFAFSPIIEGHSDIIEYNAHEAQTHLRGINKAKDMRVAMDIPEYRGRKSYAIGDSQNDILMLKEADCGIAMGQAPDCVKEIADFVTGTMGLEFADARSASNNRLSYDHSLDCLQRLGKSADMLHHP